MKFAWALRLLMSNLLEQHLYRLWLVPRQQLVPHRLKLVVAVQPLSRLTHPLQVMSAWALSLLMPNLLEQHLNRSWPGPGPGPRQLLHRQTHPLQVMSARALRLILQNQVERHPYRLWPRLRQQLVPDDQNLLH